MMGKIQIFILIAFIGLEIVSSAVLSVDRDPRTNNYKQYNTDQVDTKAKRPFCNAFTGCGRKRSERNEVVQPVPVQAAFDDEEGIANILELGSEPAIENLVRQIMSEAKMYEAIQEGNREMFLQKYKHANANRLPSAYSLQ